MSFYTVSNLDIKMIYITNELNKDQTWMHKIFVQTKFFADYQIKKFALLVGDEDVAQDAYLGLWNAIITFDYHKNFDFYRWAQWNILKKIRDNRKIAKRFRKAKSNIKSHLNSCNATFDLYDKKVMLELGYLLKQLFIFNDLKLSKTQLDIANKNIVLGKTLSEIASEYSLSVERIRQIRNSGLDELRKSLV